MLSDLFEFGKYFLKDKIENSVIAAVKLDHGIDMCC